MQQHGFAVAGKRYACQSSATRHRLEVGKVGRTANGRCDQTFRSALFTWDDLAVELGPRADKPTAADGATAGQGEPVPCPLTVPSDDPFTLALQADHGVQPQEREALLAARRKTQTGCAADAAVGAIANAEKVTKTASAKSYALYLEGAAAFWRSNYDNAAVTFASLANTPTAWVRETATYMIARVLISHAQVGAFDEYGSFKKGWRAEAKQ